MLKDHEIIKFGQDIAEQFCEIKSHQNRVFIVAENFRLLGFFTNHFKRSRCEDSDCNEIRKKFIFFVTRERVSCFFGFCLFKVFIEYI